MFALIETPPVDEMVGNEISEDLKLQRYLEKEGITTVRGMPASTEADSSTVSSHYIGETDGGDGTTVIGDDDDLGDDWEFGTANVQMAGAPARTEPGSSSSSSSSSSAAPKAKGKALPKKTFVPKHG